MIELQLATFLVFHPLVFFFFSCLVGAFFLSPKRIQGVIIL